MDFQCLVLITTYCRGDGWISEEGVKSTDRKAYSRTEPRYEWWQYDPIELSPSDPKQIEVIYMCLVLITLHLLHWIRVWGKESQRIFFSNWFSFWLVQRNGSIQLKDYWLSLDRSENICLYNTNVKNLANGPVSRVTSRYGSNMTPSSKLRLTPGFQGCFGLFGPKIVLQSSWLDWAIWAALLTEHLWEGGSV